LAAVSSPNSYALGGNSATTALAWSTATLPADVSAQVEVDLNNLIPAQLLVDGANLNGSSPTYDAIQLTRGVNASLVQVVNGKSTTLATVSSSAAGYLSGQWVLVQLTAQGTQLLGAIERTDTNQWLTAAGTWSSAHAYAFNVQTTTSLAAGVAGIGRVGSYAGTVFFDNFSAGPAGTFITPPPVSPASPPPPSTVTASPNPAAVQGYQPAPATDTLFGPNGPSPLDVHQGGLGDCWLIASLAAVAAQDPQDIVNMFTYRGTKVENGETVGLYTVRFYNAQNAPVYITVDTELPDGGSYYDAPVNGVLWVSLAEKACAIANGLGDVSSFAPNVSSYSALDAGYPSWAIQAITGQTAVDTVTSPAYIASSFEAGKFVVLPTVSPTSSYIMGGHDYVVTGYNASTGLFTLLNPWGGSTTSQWCPQAPQYYGLFTASASFITANFTGQYVPSGAADLSNVAVQGGAYSGHDLQFVPSIFVGNASTQPGGVPVPSSQWQTLESSTKVAMAQRHHGDPIDPGIQLDTEAESFETDIVAPIEVDAGE
jgi:hypothetical protein